MSTKKNKPLSLFDFVEQRPIIDRIMILFEVEDFTRLAEKVGLTYQTIRHYANGERGIGWELIFHALSKTDKGLDWLIFGKEETAVVEKMPTGRNARDVVRWVEDKGELSSDYDSGVRVAVAEKYPDFLEWQKKREGQCSQHGAMGI
jgi:transcriptional regulator with XRE-family HTH domain